MRTYQAILDKLNELYPERAVTWVRKNIFLSSIEKAREYLQKRSTQLLALTPEELMGFCVAVKPLRRAYSRKLAELLQSVLETIARSEERTPNSEKLLSALALFLENQQAMNPCFFSLIMSASEPLIVFKSIKPYLSDNELREKLENSLSTSEGRNFRKSLQNSLDRKQADKLVGEELQRLALKQQMTHDADNSHSVWVTVYSADIFPELSQQNTPIIASSVAPATQGYLVLEPVNYGRNPNVFVTTQSTNAVTDAEEADIFALPITATRLN